MPASYSQTLAPYTSVFGGGSGSLSDVYGSRPQIPMPTQTQGPALQGNISNLGSLYGLGSGINTFQNQQAALGLNQNLPGYQKLLQAASGNAQSLLQGQIPQDVVNQLTQSAAERGIATGSPGSPNANTALLAALGQTSLGLQQQGLGEFQNLAQMTPQAAPMDLSGLLVTPAQQQEAASAQALYNAAPDPSAAGTAGLGAAMGGVGAGLAAGPRAGAPVTVPPLSGGGFGGTPAYGNPDAGITYGGTVYPTGAGPTNPSMPSLGGTNMASPYMTGSYEGDVSGGYLTGDPLTDWIMGFGQGPGTTYMGAGGAGAPPDQATGGSTYMGDLFGDQPSPDELAPPVDVSAGGDDYYGG